MANNSSRFDTLESIFDKGRYFKIVCGAGNEDVDEVRKLAMVYTLAGTTAVDVSANVEVVKSAKEGIEWAMQLAPKLKRKIDCKPFINVSIGLRGDPHVRKSNIDLERCINCGTCIEACQQKAIGEDYVVNEKRCIGCGECGDACENNAIVFFHKPADFAKILPECVEAGAETMELHAITDDEDAIVNDWKMLNNTIPNNFISMCFDRDLLSNKKFIERVQFAYDVAGERTVIQADGAPMSGGKDDYRTTLQAVAVADIVDKSNIPVKILVSGGTNSRTGDLLNKCSISAHGVAIGTYARKIVYDLINNKSFEQSSELIDEAVNIAENLIKVNIEKMAHE